jgi:CRP/FNR family transcriptional regulator
VANLGVQCDYCGAGSTGSCKAFADNPPLRVLDAGDTIYRQGDVSDFVFNLVSGWVDLHRDSPDGRRQVSELLLPGELFGFNTAGARQPLGATAITPATVCVIPVARFDEFRRHNPAFNERSLGMLERQDRIATEAPRMFRQGASRERVARVLWGLAVRIAAPRPVRAGVGLKAPITRRLISDATGLTFIHVDRIIQRLREQRLVAFHDGVMIVEDPGQLAALANS